ASAGVGRAAARLFATRGYDVGLIARDRSRLEATAAEVRAAGRRAAIAECDLADDKAVMTAAADLASALGPPDVWVNNAMTSVFAEFTDIESDEFRRVTEVTYLGAVYGTRAALDRMLPRDRGVIVQVGSALAHRAIPLQSAYCGAKHALDGFTESLRCELLHRRSNVKVTIVQMPALNTPQFDWVLSRLPNRSQPVPPIYQPEVAARAIVHAAEHPRREMWVGATTVATILAQKVMPGLLDRYLARTGYRGQQTVVPADPSRPSNLWRPVPGHYAARGRFSDRALSVSVQSMLNRHRVAAAAVAAAGTALGRVALTAMRRNGASPASE
ncbi:MAG TPA: SDR family oxidoreductase, partial [Actinomycetota bacterium]|nr:SDR family oxidoreductase [Actinomycetota bacterium]